MQEYMKALTDAELSLSMCPGWVKGLFRKGRALAGLKVNGLLIKSAPPTCDLQVSCRCSLTDDLWYVYLLGEDKIIQN